MLYARLSDMAEILESRGDKEASVFHQQAAQLAERTPPPYSALASSEWGARQRFYHTAPVKDGMGLLAIRYSVWQLVGSNLIEVDPTKEFHAGDRIRLQFETNTDGYIYILNRGSSGVWQPLYPTGDQVNFARSMQPVFLPAASRMAFDNQPSTEQIYVLFSKTPWTGWPAELSKAGELFQVQNRYGTKPRQEIVGTQTSVSAPASREHALYVAQSSSDAGKPLVLGIQLKHVL